MKTPTGADRVRPARPDQLSACLYLEGPGSSWRPDPIAAGKINSHCSLQSPGFLLSFPVGETWLGLGVGGGDKSPQPYFFSAFTGWRQPRGGSQCPLPTAVSQALHSSPHQCCRGWQLTDPHDTAHGAHREPISLSPDKCCNVPAWSAACLPRAPQAWCL